MLCPRCGGKVIPDDDGGACIQCGWHDWGNVVTPLTPHRARACAGYPACSDTIHDSDGVAGYGQRMAAVLRLRRLGFTPRQIGDKLATTTGYVARVIRLYG